MNVCLETEYFSTNRKMLTVLPIPNTPTREFHKDFRIIILLPTLFKVLERIIFNKLNNYVTKNNNYLKINRDLEKVI